MDFTQFSKNDAARKKLWEDNVEEIKTLLEKVNKEAFDGKGTVAVNKVIFDLAYPRKYPPITKPNVTLHTDGDSENNYIVFCLGADLDFRLHLRSGRFYNCNTHQRLETVQLITDALPSYLRWYRQQEHA